MASSDIFHSNVLGANASGTDSSLNSPSLRLNVADVSAQFSLEYYNTMSRNPDHLHGFYGKQSQVVHSVEGDLDAPICTTLESIHARIQSMGYAGSRIIVESIDAQASLNGGIFVLTTGNMKFKNGSCKKFVQSFFLAEQPNGYYVLNDCFRFIESVNTPSTPVPATASTATAQAPKTSAPVQETKAVPAPAVQKKEPEASPVKEKAKEPVPAPQKETKSERSEPAKEKKPQQPKKTEEKPSAPSSWASLAAGRTEMWQSGVVAPSKGPIASVATEQPKEARRENAPARTFTTKSAAGAERREGGRREGNRSPRVDSNKAPMDFTRSVFIRNLGSNPEAAALRKVLEAIGPITGFDLNGFKGQAFVEFETAEMAISAINGKYQFSGNPLSIEARRPAAPRAPRNRE